MFIDAREVPSGSIVQSDICIIGGGAAGITLAQELAGRPLDVALLESGGLDFSWDAQALYGGANVGLPYFDLNVCQIRYFGGNTNAWGGWCRPLDPIDFAERPWVEYSGWPFPAAVLRPYYRRAHGLCQIAGDGYDPEAAAREIGHRRARLLPFDPQKLETTIYRFSPPTRFGQVYREKLRQARTIRCYLNANALGLETSHDARTVLRVRAGCLTGTRFEFAARLFVLAAGGLENARLLLLSNDVAADGIGNRHGLVGRFFMEHPHTKRALVATSRPMESALYGLTFRNDGLVGRLSLPAALQEKERLLNYSANIHPCYLGHNSAGWLAFRKLVLSLDAGRSSDPFVRFPPYGRRGLTPREALDMIRQFDRVAIAALLQYFQPGRLMRGFLVESKPEQAPNPLSRVTLDHARDAFGRNRVKLEWRTLPIDWRTVVRAEEILDGELRRLGLGRLAPLGPGKREGWPANLEGGWHQIGTTRADTDPKRGVVDAELRVHGTANLFVAGSSVFPTGGAAPPTLTIVALALRLAEHLQREIASSRAVQPLAARPVAEAASIPILAAPALARGAHA